MIDSGAELSVISKRDYDLLKHKPPLKMTKINLKAVDGNSLYIRGNVKLKFKIGSIYIEHPFFVVENINRNVILGRDFLQDNGVRLYFDLGCLRIKDCYVPLEEDVHLSIIARLTRHTVLKPQTAYRLLARTKRNGLRSNQNYDFTGISNSFFDNEPGLTIVNSVVKTTRDRKFPILIINNTHKTIRLRRNCPIGQLQSIQDNEICSIESVIKNNTPKSGLSKDEILSDLHVAGDQKENILPILLKHRTLFARNNLELTQTTAMEFNIDTGDHPPIKLRPYRTPLNNKVFIDKAIDEMLTANIISPSRSPWSFPIVLVDKKKNNLDSNKDHKEEKRFCVDFRQLNKITKPKAYPLPLIDDILAL